MVDIQVEILQLINRLALNIFTGAWELLIYEAEPRVLRVFYCKEIR